MADPEEFVAICSRLTSAPIPRTDNGRMWLFSGGIYTLFFVSVPPNSPIPDCGTDNLNGRGVFAARSYHPGGVNAAMADGSVRWFASTIDEKTWRALGTRSGGEAVTVE
jgi:prepilin-type processing-associated H-X9-DG protein